MPLTPLSVLTGFDFLTHDDLPDASTEILIAAISTPQTITNSIGTNVQFDSIVLDTLSALSLGVFTVPASLNGKLLAINAQVIWDANATGHRAATMVRTGSLVLMPFDIKSAETFQTVCDLNTVAKVATGDTILIRVEQSSGGDLDIISPQLYQDTFIRISVVE